jgi:predicted small metal-binding protein
MGGPLRHPHHRGAGAVAKRLACRDHPDFPDCPAIMRGDTEEEIILQAQEHGRQAHGMTDEQVDAPSVLEGIRRYIRDT